MSMPFKPAEAFPWAFLCLLLVAADSARAQDDLSNARFRESISIETSRQASRQFASAIEQIRAARWNDAADELSRIMNSEGDALVPVAPGRYLNVRRYANLIAVTLPQEGLKAFRERIDTQAMLEFERGRDSTDELSLRRVVRDAFASSVGGDALLLLGDTACERQDFDAARSYWMQLLAYPDRASSGSTPPVFRFPDSGTPRPAILSRLILCSLLEGNRDRDRAQQELAAFARLYPDARGEFAGRSGVYAEILKQIAKESESWRLQTTVNDMPTFAVNARRNGVFSEQPEFEVPIWSHEIAADAYRSGEASEFFERKPLSTFPVVHEKYVFINDAQRILAFEAATGRPAWSEGENSSPVIYPTVPDPQPPLPEYPLAGSPCYTMSISEGRLYARMGSPVTGKSVREQRPQFSQLVCLDIDRGEGKLVWRIDSSEAFPGGLAFEGSPVVDGARLFVALRQGFPETQSNVACIDAESGRPLWNRRIGAAVSDLSESQNLVSHHLLTLGDDAAFYATEMGGIAALEKSDGVIRWVTTYPAAGGRLAQYAGDPAKPGLTPCLYHQGLVIVAPRDCHEIFAIDASTGARLWERTLPGGVTQLLGVGSGALVAAGNSLWGLDPVSGRVRWQVGYSDPTAGSYGQGLLAGTNAYWPTHDEIYIVDQSTGEIRRRIPLSSLYELEGGNLAMGSGFLVVAGPQRITLFGNGRSIPSPSDAVLSDR